MGSECARPVEALAGESSIGGERGLADLHCFQGVLVRGMGGGLDGGEWSEGYVLQSTAHLGALCALRSTALLRAARNTFRPGGSNGFLLLQILCSLSTSTEFPLPFALQILLVKQSLCEFYQTIPAYVVVFFLPGPCYEAVAKGKFFLLMHQIDRTHECWKLFTLPSKWPELWRSEIPSRSLQAWLKQGASSQSLILTTYWNSEFFPI